MYDDVLIATDGSDVATNAATAGITLAATLEADVHVVSVVESGLRREESRRERHERDAREIADRAQDAGCHAEAVVRSGRPASELLSYADDADVDLIVVGTQGRTGLRQALLGSVALEVIRDARRPVLTVGPDTSWEVNDGPIDDVCLATDGAPGATAATEHALSMADVCDARLHALYAVAISSEATEIREAFAEYGEKMTSEVVDRATDRGLETTRTIEHGAATDVVLEYTDDAGVDLLVMGTESKSNVERLVLGSVSQRVVPNANVPVMTVRTLKP
ncbi:universal stress protein [Natrarchaeobaculum sulfurireducens]|uniref:Nucleotide-binding protein, UspA family n=1 Tax=Natrarchaeobaculum sulfurireducens TaxID=2044521 RepID=A0A346PG70_9EURY|nr:universal stress protein [Natrarchaeobaculum sulfurireducens]AXR78515.1 Nucleotide-binding protein, UspA family [Natrarchaeobaculum sulfurireducens]